METEREVKAEAFRKAQRTHTKIVHAAKNDRKNTTMKNLAPKKRGHGGKFTWSGDARPSQETEFEKGALDEKDPNYEDPEEVTVVM